LANTIWWQGQRIIFPAQIVQPSRFSAFDAKQLDTPRDRWQDADRSYWADETTEHPRIEVVVDGALQFEGWQPFAQLLSPGP
jgi:hypothetical protein